MEELQELILSNNQEYELSNIKLKNTELELPVILSNKVLLTEGTWNGLFFSKDSIKRGFETTDWSDKKNSELIKDHADKPLSVNDFVGYVKNIRLSKPGEFDGNGKLLPENSLLGDLELWDKEMVIKLAFAKAKFGISAKVHGIELEDGSFQISKYGNFSIVDNPACKNAYVNLSDDGSNKPCEKCSKYPCECGKEEDNKKEDEEMACKKKLEEEKLNAEVDAKVSSIKDSLKKKHPKWSDKKIESAAWAITKSQEKKMSEEDEISEDDFKEDDIEKEEEIKKDDEELQSNLLKGGLKEEQKMESKSNEVETPVDKVAVVDSTEQASEVKVEESLNEKLLAQITALSNEVKILSERIEKMEKNGLKAKELSAKVDGASFRVSKPMTVQELSSTKDGRHTNGVLAMAQQVMSLQSQ